MSMMGLPERTIVMSCEEAKEYVSSKLVVLMQHREELQKELDNINEQIDIEMDKLEMLNNPPHVEEHAVQIKRLSQF